MKISPLVAVATVLVLTSVVVSIALYDRIPDPVPTHFDFHGEPNGWVPKPFGAFIGPVGIAVLAAVLLALPKISPRGYLIEPFRRTYDIVACAVLGLLFIISTAAISLPPGMRLGATRMLPVAVGVLLLILGNFMGKLRRNFFIGIRTPWTLASEEVWFRTHRLGGRVMVAAGLILMAGAFFGAGPNLMLIVIGVAAVWLTVYSYVVYRQVGDGASHDDGASHT